MDLEGLRVFVQTTRLVLFEFFDRFLQAEGRLFRPLCHRDRHPDPAALTRDGTLRLRVRLPA